MEHKKNQSLKQGEQGKYTNYKAQRHVIYNAFYSQSLTMLQVARKTGIERANICRRIAELRKQKRIILVRKGFCPITQHRSGFYTTNPNLYPELWEKLV